MSARILSKKLVHELCQAAIRIPEKITLDDGREIIFTKWTPTVSHDSLVTVSIEGVIRLSDAQTSQIGHQFS